MEELNNIPADTWLIIGGIVVLAGILFYISYKSKKGKVKTEDKGE